MRAEGWIEEELARLREKSSYRSLTVYHETGVRIRSEGKTYLNFSSNDYLNMFNRPEVIAASRKMLEQYGCGATASRLVAGTLAFHEALERELAEFKGYPEAIVFGSGFLTNAGVIPALVGKSDHVFSDKLAHASIIDGIGLSRAERLPFQHNDVDHLDHLLRNCRSGNRKLIVTESVFSMDGDLAPLPEIASIAVKHGAMLMVDEAHASGIFGPSGSGLIREHGLEDKVNVSMGTLSKALGGYGGFVACSSAVRQLLVNRTRSFLYTTGLPPAVIGSALGALQVIKDDPGMGARLLDKAAYFRKLLREGGLDVGPSESQIIPIIIGENYQALAVAQRLRTEGILAVAIRPPTVPEGTSRLRFSVTLGFSREDLEWAAERIIKAVIEEGRL